MSKGPGKQQRRILKELKKRPMFYLADLFEGESRAGIVALIRAAHKLDEQRKAVVMHAYRTRPLLVVAQKKYSYPRRITVYNPLTLDSFGRLMLDWDVKCDESLELIELIRDRYVLKSPMARFNTYSVHESAIPRASTSPPKAAKPSQGRLHREKPR